MPKILHNRIRSSIFPILVLALIVLLLTPNVRAASIIEHNLPPGSAKPYGIVSNSTHIWAAEYGSDKLVALKKDAGTMYEFKLPDGTRPYDIVLDEGAWGSYLSTVWFTASSSHKIGYLSLASAGGYVYYEYTIPPERQPQGIAIQNGYSGAYPRIWFTESKGVIGAIDVSIDNLVEWYLPDENCGPLSAIYLDSTGLWFTEYNSHRIGNLYYDGANYRLKEWPLKPSSFPWGLANDAFGNIWFTESGTNRIGRLNPYTNEITEYMIPTPSSEPRGITIDSYNNVWFAEHATNKIARFKPGLNNFVEFTRTVGGAPFEILWEPGTDAGTVEVWFSDEGGNRIGELDSGKATTSMTVSTITTAISEHSTATTMGSSVATKTNGPIATVPITTAWQSSSVTTKSTTQYSVSETSRILVTSQGLVSTSNTTVTGTTTSVTTSYTNTASGTTSVSATQIVPATVTTEKPTTATFTTYVATTKTTAVVPTYTTVTSYVLGTATGGTGGALQIPGYSTPAVGAGLVLGAMALVLGTFLARGSKRLPSAKGRWIVVLILLSIMFIGALAQPSNAAGMTEWSLPPGSNIPYGITFDDQSPYSVWFTEFGSDKIGRLNHLSGEIWEVKVRADAKPWGIAFENARHEVWFTMSGQDRVGVIGGYGGGSVKEIELGFGSGGPRGIAIQEYVNGTDFPYIWVAHFEGKSIFKLDPYDKGTLTQYDLSSDGTSPKAIVFSKDTGVWFTDVQAANYRIGNLNPLTGELRYWRLPSDAGSPEGLTLDSLGMIWFTEDGNSHVSRLNPYSGELMRFRMPSASSQPYGIAADALDHLWIADHGLNRITRFSPGDLTFTEFQRTGGLPWGVAVSKEGWIWFTDESGNRIGRMDKTLNRMTVTTTSISTVSKTTSTIAASQTVHSAEPPITDATTIDGTTTVTYAPTTVTTTYGQTETVWLLQTKYTQTVTDYSTTTLYALGETTSYQTTTVGTVTTTSLATSTLIVTTPQTVNGTATSTSTQYTLVTIVTEIAMGPGIPGFNMSVVLIGLIAGALGLVAFHRSRRR